ncbi:hypothetical protein CMU59_11715 [Elizabethkingia anophelis]|uniref:hypothetical protein n=1 Tax=Elizabethkingia anophelis TaxID=1117645 RepID=UPI0021A5ED3E|nr:hypothetical protein [Elizabethkingia anophelis]MCT3947680.1 hypothetical protein [Elizabethkingia anophelis]MDV3573714.1 hypothetical protein [Elizabethkingia anophelis]MDV3598392.1 hypothetical protein [Elizabethkingia anophelis]MDV3606159.1 hypothetical protein [Elizabethkingia anophelis]
MKINLILLYLFFLFIASSCHKEIKSDKGGIDIISNVYFDASKGLNKMQSFHVSKLNYSKNELIEEVPDLSFPEISKQMYYIRDSLYYPFDLMESNLIFSDLSKKRQPFLVWEKKQGAVFSKEWIPNYRNRRNLSDTILFQKKYRRFEINSPWTYTRFYIYPTDTILPYSLYKHAEKDYNGRLERIDSYNKKDDIFVTLQLLPRKNWDSDVKELLEFNHFVKSRKSE